MQLKSFDRRPQVIIVQARTSGEDALIANGNNIIDGHKTRTLYYAAWPRAVLGHTAYRGSLGLSYTANLYATNDVFQLIKLNCRNQYVSQANHLPRQTHIPILAKLLISQGDNIARSTSGSQTCHYLITAVQLY